MKKLCMLFLYQYYKILTSQTTILSNTCLPTGPGRNFIHLVEPTGQKMAKLLLLTIISLVGSSQGFKILFFNGFASHSHLVAFEPLANSMADDGHSVTIFSAMESKNTHPSIKYFCPEVFKAMQSDLNIIGEYAIQSRLQSKYNDFFLQTTEAWDGTADLCKAIYQSQDFLEWLHKSSFDLVVIDSFQRECGMPLAAMFQAKQIIFMPTTLFYGDQDVFGFTTDASFTLPWATESYWGIPDSIVYEFNNLKWYFWRRWRLQPRVDATIQEDLNTLDTLKEKGIIIPTTAELEKKTSMYFVNQHFGTADFSRTIPQFVVPVGGMHCRPAKNITDKTILDAIDNSDGFVYISFGSFLKVSGLPKEMQSVFFDTMAKFPKIKFLWKWEDEPPASVPKNVLLMKWFPQQDILGHPKCKGFIGQGGMMSFQQAIFHGTPVITIPGGGDQIFNARMTPLLKIGIHLELSELTSVTFGEAIFDLLNNEKYSKEVKDLSVLFRDRPMSPLDTAKFWTNYVLRHNDYQLSRLKPPGINQYWWQRRLFHVWLLMLIVIAILIAIRILVVYYGLKLFRSFIKYIRKPKENLDDSKKDK